MIVSPRPVRPSSVSTTTSAAVPLERRPADPERVARPGRRDEDRADPRDPHSRILSRPRRRRCRAGMRAMSAMPHSPASSASSWRMVSRTRPRRRRRPARGPWRRSADEHGARAEGQRDEDVGAGPDAAVEVDLGPAVDGRRRRRAARRASPVERSSWRPPWFGHEDAPARRRRPPARVLAGHHALGHDRQRGAAGQPLEVLPGVRRRQPRRRLEVGERTPAGSRKPIRHGVCETPIGVLTRGTIARTPRRLGACDDRCQGVAVVPVVELEPERQVGLGGGDVLDARRRVDRHDEQAARARDALRHRQLAIRMDGALEPIGATTTADATSAQERGRDLTLDTSTRTRGRSRRRPNAATLSRSDCRRPLPVDPVVGRRVEHVARDVGERRGSSRSMSGSATATTPRYACSSASTGGVDCRQSADRTGGRPSAS